MNRRAMTLRVSVGLVGLTICALVAADMLGLIPDQRSALVAGRVALVESVEIACAAPSGNEDLASIEWILRDITRRNSDVVSAGVRLPDGSLAVNVRDHTSHWVANARPTDINQLQIPLRSAGRPWGSVELRFEQANPIWLTLGPTVPIVLFVAAASFLGQHWYLQRMAHQLNPEKMVPDSLRMTLNSFSEGLLILDSAQRIALANSSFAKKMGVRANSLLGQPANKLSCWSRTNGAPIEFPWDDTMRTGQASTDRRLRARLENGIERIFQVNCTPIVGDDGDNNGAMVTFRDVTDLEMRNEKLHQTLSRLESSREQIRRHNEELRVLASFDPLTGCLNRRSFFEKLDNVIANAHRGMKLSYIICDVDHFKAVNDNHGHAVGDDVLQAVGRMIKERFNSRGNVCRYGGEEFSVLLPDLAVEEAYELADEFRRTLENTRVSNLQITASLGVAEFDLSSPNPHEAVELADRALYAAKRRGRNRVVRWDDIRDSDEASGDPQRPTLASDTDSAESHRIPFNAVSALSAALFHRDASTADHCRRVAQLSAAAARGLLSEKDRHVLEVAALLHDIGKLGIPDEILHKPGRLTEQEWSVMRTYEQIGVTIIEHAFTCPELIELLRTCRLHYDGSGSQPGAPTHENIPLAARILSIADAFDSMLQQRDYRNALSQEEAFDELRRSAGTQFDPALVERFIEGVLSLGGSNRIGGITPRSALQLGMETEQLACALDAQDRATVKTMAGRIRQMAVAGELAGIIELTDAVDSLVDTDADWLEVLNVAVELLDTCRVAQWSSVGEAKSNDQAAAASD